MFAFLRSSQMIPMLWPGDHILELLYERKWIIGKILCLAQEWCRNGPKGGLNLGPNEATMPKKLTFGDL